VLAKRNTSSLVQLLSTALDGQFDLFSVRLIALHRISQSVANKFAVWQTIDRSFGEMESKEANKLAS
jgi:hypothetical protein